MSLRFALVSLGLLVIPCPAAAQWGPVGVELGIAGNTQSICPDGAGGAFVAWRRYSTVTEYDVYMQHVTAAGTIAQGWPIGGLPACVQPGGQFPSSPVPDGLGGVFVAWQDFRESPTKPDIYALRITAGGAIAPGWPLDGAPVTRAVDYQIAPVIAPDGTGGAFFTWADFSPASDLYAQHLTATGEVAEGWPADGLPVCTISDASVPAIIPDGTGGALIAWTDVRGGVRGIYAQRISPSGAIAPGWVPDGVPVVLEKIVPRLVPDGAGGFYVACAILTEFGFDSDYYVQRVTFAGTVAPGWPAEGIRVCTAPGDRANMVAASDAGGSLFLTWHDYRDPFSGGDIYALRVRPDGSNAPGWTVNGLRVSNLTSLEYSAFIAPDGLGGAYITWRLEGGGIGFRFRVQHLAANGAVAPGWLPNGTLVGTSTSQFDPRITSDGAGGAIVAWEERSLGRIYAQRFVEDGVVPVLLSLVSAEARPEGVVLIWQGAETAGLEAAVYRRTELSPWLHVGTLAADGVGRLRFEDRTVSPGQRYAYRLGYSEAESETFTTETWVDVPALRLALDGARPNPAFGELNVAFTLPSALPASLELLDVQGRQVLAREVGSLGPGRHTVPLASGSQVPPGMYWLALRQDGRTVVSRASVIR